MKTFHKIMLLLLLAAATSCEDVIEDDITNDTILLISPMNDDEIESNVVSFQWSSLEGADKYRIQVFKTNQAIVLDSLVDQNHFTVPISQGQYQWRVRGENSAYQSTYSINMAFSVIESLNLENQQVLLSGPANSYYTNATSLICAWQNLSAAESYSFELIDVTNGETLEHSVAGLTTTSVALTSSMLTDEAQYRWKVKAVNSTSESQFSSRIFLIDRTNPNQPVNSLPANNSTQTINLPINFSWTVPTDTGTIQSPIAYKIEFSTDAAFTNIFFTGASNTASYDYTFTTAGTYFWRVKGIDQALNSGSYSTNYKIVLN